MADDTALRNFCSVEDCTKPERGNTGYCYAHYMKNWRYGTPTPQHPPRQLSITPGQRFGLLVVIEHQGNARWLCRCDCGAKKQVRSGDLNRGSAQTCGDRRRHWRRETVAYHTLHDRLDEDRGRASEHACVDCGAPAQHWSYDHADLDELVGQNPRSTAFGLSYSLKPEHYDPRCVPCHRRFDRRLGPKPPKPLCAVLGCDLPAHARSMCGKHYRRWHTHGTTDPPPPPRSGCTAPNCDRPHYGHGYCQLHWQRRRRG